MLQKNLRKLFQCSTLATAMLIGFASLAHATEARREDTTPQPESSQTPQQATPTKSAVEPVDADEGTALA